MTLEIRWTGRLDALDEADREDLIARQGGGVPEEVRERVARIAEVLEEDGDEALVAFTERFDDVELDRLTVPREAWRNALDEAPRGFEAAFTTAADQVRAYHEALAARRRSPFQLRGVAAHERAEPVPRAGAYVPGGEAAYPSTVAMTAVPAQVAGVDEVTVASPPGPDGRPNPLVLAACHLLDVDRVVPLGGAQAVLALAHGTETLPGHPVVVGPGNAYVQAAKERVAGSVRIDAPAGPSEVAALADDVRHARATARELAAQAEHAADTQPVAVCEGADVAEAVVDALDELVPTLDRADTVREALAQNGAVLEAEDTDEAATFLDELAPEHCVLFHEEADRLAATLTGPACIVTGPQARVPLADYGAGPSHVLPTGGHARSYSGVDLETFSKNVHVVEAVDPDPELVDAAATLARLEGLTAHARALEEEEP